MSPTENALLRAQILRVLGDHHRAQHRNLNLPYLLTAKLDQYLRQECVVQMTVRDTTEVLRQMHLDILNNPERSPGQRTVQSYIVKMDTLHSTVHGVIALEYLYPELFSAEANWPVRKEFQAAYLEVLSALHRNWEVTRPMAREILILAGRQLVDYHLCSIQNLPAEFTPESKIELSGCRLPFALANSPYKGSSLV